MMKELNEIQCKGTLIAREGSFNSVKNALLNDPKYQKGGFWSFLGLMSFVLT